MTKIKSEQINTSIDEKDKLVDNASDVDFEEQYETDFDFDFWQDVLTSYGEIGSKEELKLILSKLKIDYLRENQKVSKIKSIISSRNAMNKKKTKRKAKASKKALSALPPQKRLEYKQVQAEKALKEKQLELVQKAENIELKQKEQEEQLDKKQFMKSYLQQEKIALLSMTPAEKREYLFQKNAKKKIDGMNAKIEKARDNQAQASQSTALPIKGFLYFILASMVVAAILTFFVTNIYLDTKAYDEKISTLKEVIVDYDEKLNGDMVVGVSNIQSGLAVYDQILANGPVMEEQLIKLNSAYKWLLEKETTESLGIDVVTVKSNNLASEIAEIKGVMNKGTSFVENINRVYNSDKSLPDTIEALNGYSGAADTAIAEFSALKFPNGLEEHQTAYIENIKATQNYYLLLMEYVNELAVLHEDIADVSDAITDAQGYKPRSSYSLSRKVRGYLDKLDDAIDCENKIIALNNKVEYASIIGKKDLTYIANPEISQELLDFYYTINKLKLIYITSDKVELKCLDLPYPDNEQTDDEEIIKYMTQNYSEAAIVDNQEIYDQLKVLLPPERIATTVRSYLTGLEIRGEFLALQKQYLDLEEEKNGYYLETVNAGAQYDLAYNILRAHRREYGNDDAYDKLYAELKVLDKNVDEKEDKAKDMGDEIKDKMKDVRTKARKLKREYSEYMDYD